MFINKVLKGEKLLRIRNTFKHKKSFHGGLQEKKVYSRAFV